MNHRAKSLISTSLNTQWNYTVGSKFWFRALLAVMERINLSSNFGAFKYECNLLSPVSMSALELVLAHRVLSVLRRLSAHEAPCGRSQKNNLWSIGQRDENTFDDLLDTNMSVFCLPSIRPLLLGYRVPPLLIFWIFQGYEEIDLRIRFFVPGQTKTAESGLNQQRRGSEVRRR